MSAPNRCPCEGGTLDRLIQPAILVVLAEGPLHGYRLAERIREIPGFAGQKPDVSGVYRLLGVMEGKGLVVASWDLSASGPPKKSYQITACGRQCLRRWIKTLEGFRREVDALLTAARKAGRKEPQSDAAPAARPMGEGHGREGAFHILTKAPR
jgi:DNA-binding PadR family transcriptional regulator